MSGCWLEITQFFIMQTPSQGCCLHCGSEREQEHKPGGSQSVQCSCKRDTSPMGSSGCYSSLKLQPRLSRGTPHWNKAGGFVRGLSRPAITEGEPFIEQSIVCHYGDGTSTQSYNGVAGPPHRRIKVSRQGPTPVPPRPHFL